MLTGNSRTRTPVASAYDEARGEPDHFFYGRVTVVDVPEIVDGLVKGQPVKRLVVTADQHEAR